MKSRDSVFPLTWLAITLVVRLSGAGMPEDSRVLIGDDWHVTFFEVTFSFSSSLLYASSNQKPLNTKNVWSENPICTHCRARLWCDCFGTQGLSSWCWLDLWSADLWWEFPRDQITLRGSFNDFSERTEDLPTWHLIKSQSRATTDLHHKLLGFLVHGPARGPHTVKHWPTQGDRVTVWEFGAPDNRVCPLGLGWQGSKWLCGQQEPGGPGAEVIESASLCWDENTADSISYQLPFCVI